MFKKILIANRGEIAVRIIRTCKKLKIKTVSIYSENDKNSIHLYLADEIFYLGNENDAYLNIKKILEIAKAAKVDAVHPGYGFLSEDYKFAEMIRTNKITFIGPNNKLIKIFGNKIKTLYLARKTGFNILPILNYSIYGNKKILNKIGYPILIKSISGGGGKGIRFVKNEKDLNDNILLASIESEKSYKNKLLYIEKYLENSRHIEFQMLCDGEKAIIIGERECSIQINYQKIIEESPINNINRKNLNDIKLKCKFFFEKIKYENIGTIEFLYNNKMFYFIEVNPRLQVEHTITENITDIDIVQKQIEIAYKKKININNIKLRNNKHSIQCRINIEEFKENKIKFLHIPSGKGIRFDSHIYNGYEIPIKYDKLLGKLTTYSKTRKDSIDLMLTALNEIIIYNIKTNIGLLIKILSNKYFKKNKLKTTFLNDYKVKI